MQLINTFYIQGFNPSIKPGLTQIRIKKDGFVLHKQVIGWQFVTDAQMRYEVSEKATSPGKAVAGAVVAGGVGAIVGGMMGSKKVESYLTISYKTADGINKIILCGRNSPRILNLIQKHINKRDRQPGKTITTTSPTKPISKTILGWYKAMWRIALVLPLRLIDSIKPKTK